MYIAYIIINPDFGHVITGNVDIVTNNNLRRIFHKGLNFIEATYRNKAEILSSICNDLKIFTKKLSTKFSVSDISLVLAIFYTMARYHEGAHQ